MTTVELITATYINHGNVWYSGDYKDTYIQGYILEYDKVKDEVKIQIHDDTTITKTRCQVFCTVPTELSRCGANKRHRIIY